MKLCKNCKNFRGRRCWCRENIFHSFHPIEGEQRKIRDSFFEEEANKHGDCIWYERKWWKFWVKGEGIRFTNLKLGDLLAFIKGSYPEILMEYALLGSKKPLPQNTRPKPTPNPTGGVKIQ